MVLELNHKLLKKHIKKSYLVQHALMVWGAPGIGKSYACKEVAQELAKENNSPFIDGGNEDDSFGFIDLRLASLDPSDLRGLPFPDKETMLTQWFIPSFLPTKGKGILFLDEINLAPGSIQGAAYQLIHDRKLGDYKLPDGWGVVAAGNRINDGAQVFEMLKPLQNRFSHVQLKEPNIDTWLEEFALPNKIDTRIMGFLRFKRDYLFKFDAQSKEVSFPTPRSWEFTSDYIKGVKDVEEVYMYTASTVGTGIAHEFKAFVEHQLNIDISKMLKNPKLFKSLDGVDKKYACITAICDVYNNSFNTKEEEQTFNTALNFCNNINPEFGAFLLHIMRTTNNDIWSKYITENNKIVLQTIEKYGKYLV